MAFGMSPFPLQFGTRGGSWLWGSITTLIQRLLTGGAILDQNLDIITDENGDAIVGEP